MKSQEQKKVDLIYLKTLKKKYFFFSPAFSILTFFAVFKNAPEYIDPPGHFVFYEIFVAQTSRTNFFSSNVVKFNISSH